MDTRRIRRHERRRTRHNVVTATSVAVIGVAVGTALPRSATASVALLACGACCLAVVVMRDPSFAPLHGLRGVVRLSWRRSLAVTLESFTSRFVGTVHAVVTPQPAPTPIEVDEPDDEAAEPAGFAAPPAALAPWPPPPPPAPPLPAPVLAAPMPSAHVPSRDAYSPRAWVAQLGMHVRRWKDHVSGHQSRSTEGVSAST
jgi:hypothetical protein